MADKRMSVQVKTAPVRLSPTFMGRVKTTLNYGDSVETLEENGDWIRIVSGSVQGWMHKTALTGKKIVFQAGSQDVRKTASADEIALAGKGFNKQVEKEFQSRHPGVNFAWIDRMETFRVSDEDIRQFLYQGRLGA